MAWIMSPQRSPLDQGASFETSKLLTRGMSDKNEFCSTRCLIGSWIIESAGLCDQIYSAHSDPINKSFGPLL